MLGWRAWYTGGRVFASDELAWEDLPDDGVLVVVVLFRDGTSRFCSGDDWYWRLGDTICHNSRPLEENEARYPGCAFKRGMWTTEAELAAATAAAAALAVA